MIPHVVWVAESTWFAEWVQRGLSSLNPFQGGVAFVKPVQGLIKHLVQVPRAIVALLAPCDRTFLESHGRPLQCELPGIKSTSYRKTTACNQSYLAAHSTMFYEVG